MAPDLVRCGKHRHLTPTAALFSQHRETIVRNADTEPNKGRQIEPTMGPEAFMIGALIVAGDRDQTRAG